MLGNNIQPTYKRQRFLLSFIRQLQDGVTSTDLQKLVFLHMQKEGLDFYKFIPYKYGSYSFQLAEDVDILRKDKYLSIKGTRESTRIKAIGKYHQVDSFQIATERGNNLIRKAYCEYPYYTINSKITGRLFSGAEAEWLNHEKQKHTRTEQVLFTIGYEGKSIESFINTLILNDVRLLCDVRKNPLSRKFGFSKGKLKHITESIGIKYIHIPDLGIESGKRNLLDTAEDYERLFRGFANDLLNKKSQLDDIYSLLCTNVRIALMCFEKKSEMCHRHIIRDFLSDTHIIRSMDL